MHNVFGIQLLIVRLVLCFTEYLLHTSIVFSDYIKNVIVILKKTKMWDMIV